MFLFASPALVLAFWTPGPGEMFLLLVIALLLYGGELPEKAREWGKTLADLRSNLGGIQKDLNDAIYSEPAGPRRLQHYPEFRDVEPLDSSGKADDEGDRRDDPDANAARSAASDQPAD